MQGDDSDNVVADLIHVYTLAVTNGEEAAQRCHDPNLSMMERLAYRHKALRMQELAEQALRMVDELTTRTAA